MENIALSFQLRVTILSSFYRDKTEFEEHCNVADIHFPDNSFDFIICTAAFKNFKEPLRALNQMCRVLKSGGTALIADMDRDASNQQIED
jgi:ubiquinone/menaquinone biosynthesis C-methylase UbiE